MTESADSNRPDLHLPAEYMSRATKALAQLYREDIKIPVGNDQESIAKQSQRDDFWRKVANQDFPLLASQILGLRNSLRSGREYGTYLPAGQRMIWTSLLTKGYTFDFDETRSFLEDIFMNRIKPIARERDGYADEKTLGQETEKMRGELGFKKVFGVFNLTLEKTIELALENTLDTIYRPPIPRAA